jgi:hypothetical protein
MRTQSSDRRSVHVGRPSRWRSSESTGLLFLVDGKIRSYMRYFTPPKNAVIRSVRGTD